MHAERLADDGHSLSKLSKKQKRAARHAAKGRARAGSAQISASAKALSSFEARLTEIDAELERLAHPATSFSASSGSGATNRLARNVGALPSSLLRRQGQMDELAEERKQLVAAIERAKADAQVPVTDRAVIRYLERVLGVDVNAIRADIANHDDLRAMIHLFGHGIFPFEAEGKALRAVVRDGHILTIVTAHDRDNANPEEASAEMPARLSVAARRAAQAAARDERETNATERGGLRLVRDDVPERFNDDSLPVARSLAS